MKTTTCLFFLLLFFLFQACKKDTPDVTPPVNPVSGTLPVTVASEIQNVTSIISPVSEASAGKIQIVEGKQNNFILGLNPTGDVLVVGLPRDGKIALDYESTAMSMAKLILMPYASSNVALETQLTAIKASTSYQKLLDAVTLQLRQGQSPFDSQQALDLALEVADEAEENLIASGGLRRAAQKAAEKHSLLAGLDGFSYWVEETKTAQQITQLEAFNNTRVNWMIKVEDEAGKLIDSVATEPTEFADDFTKITSYRLNPPKANPLKFSQKYKATIYQTDATREKNLSAVLTGFFNILWDFIPYDDKQLKCYGSYLNKMVFTTLPNLKERTQKAQTESEKAEAVFSYLFETFLYEKTYESGEDFINTMMECNPTWRTKSSNNAFLRYFQIQSMVLRKLHRGLKNLFEPFKYPLKGLKLYTMLFQSAEFYDAKFDYQNYVNKPEPFFELEVDSRLYTKNEILFISERPGWGTIASTSFDDQKTIRTQIDIQPPFKVGTYDLSGAKPANGGRETQALVWVWNTGADPQTATLYYSKYAGGGQLNITEVTDTHISGTFNFQAASLVKSPNGNYSVPGEKITTQNGKFRITDIRIFK